MKKWLLLFILLAAPTVCYTQQLHNSGTYHILPVKRLSHYLVSFAKAKQQFAYLKEASERVNQKEYYKTWRTYDRSQGKWITTESLTPLQMDGLYLYNAERISAELSALSIKMQAIEMGVQGMAPADDEEADKQEKTIESFNDFYKSLEELKEDHVERYKGLVKNMISKYKDDKKLVSELEDYLERINKPKEISEEGDE